MAQPPSVADTSVLTGILATPHPQISVRAGSVVVDALVNGIDSEASAQTMQQTIMSQADAATLVDTAKFGPCTVKNVKVAREEADAQRIAAEHAAAVAAKALRLKEDKILENEELMRVKRKQKEAYEEEERARARESEQNTIKDMEKKEYDAERQKRLDQDKYMDNMERQRVIRQAKQEEEWEVRARQIEAEEQTVYHLKKEEEKKAKEKRLFQDKMLDNEELMRVKREQREAYEEEERARARESEQNTIKDMEKKEYDAERQKRLDQDKCEFSA